MKKKIFMICAMVIMCVCVFVGCNKADDGKVTTTTEGTTTTTTMTETTESIGEDLSSRLESGVSEAVTDMEDMDTTSAAA